MAIAPELLPTTCEIRRPFGAGSATYTNVRCRLVADFARSREAAVAGPDWTHYLVVDVAADIRDACTRAAGTDAVTYADGDEVRVPSGAATPRFVVVWVETVDAGTPREFKRAYLMRHVP
ncbi:MAG TPA: hypothetical protein VKD90_26095 [Gemmataceae bacterium]|nr:hypothetical protein [Gemmataceae bacterium]